MASERSENLELSSATAIDKFTLVPLLCVLALPAAENIKHLIARYSEFVWTTVQPLGSWAVFLIAGMDSAFWGLPLDPVVASYVYHDHPRSLLYALMAASGSAAGCTILYAIGHKGGEALLEKRISKEKFAKMRGSFESHGFWALMVPAMLPPPFPFKLFVLSASAFEMNFWYFLFAIFTGRFVRFLLLSVLVIKFGERVVAVLPSVLAKHWAALLLVSVVGAGVFAWMWYEARSKNVPTE